MSDPTASKSLVGEGRKVLEIESAAIQAAAERIGDSFAEACRIIAGTKGHVVCCGIGKSGLVARKIAATLTSTGTRALFLHPAEALHGDLGVVHGGDVVIFVSKSGDVAEFGGLLDHFSRVDAPIISIVGDVQSDLARASIAVLDCSVDEEACPLDLAPTASTSVAMALGDALSMTVLQMRGFDAESFAALHPGGALGRRLTLRVSDVMVADELPQVPLGSPMRETISLLAEKRGTLPILDADGRLAGVLTAGDLTRLMETRADFLDVPVDEVMTRDPKVADPDELASAAVVRMEQHGIMALPVLDEERRLVGVVHLHDLMRSGAV